MNYYFVFNIRRRKIVWFWLCSGFDSRPGWGAGALGGGMGCPFAGVGGMGGMSWFTTPLNTSGVFLHCCCPHKFARRQSPVFVIHYSMTLSRWYGLCGLFILCACVLFCSRSVVLFKCKIWCKLQRERCLLRAFKWKSSIEKLNTQFYTQGWEANVVILCVALVCTA